MKSGYKRIGNYIRLVDERNRGLKVTTLLGLSIEKVFIASVANIIGSDMANYKIIRKGQFACSLMQVRRDKKIPVALLRDFDEAIISQAYPVFEIIDRNELDSEYLMMWMSRPEFDRHACFLAVGGVRGSLEWEDFCDMELPVPSIDKQREIVREYNTIVNRIQLNEQMNQKLEETAQAIYKHWFVDFEFPISAEYAASIDKPELEGKPYKSSGGEMVFCEELDQEVPKNWHLSEIKKIGNVITGKTPSSSTPDHFGHEMDFVTPTDFGGFGKYITFVQRKLSAKGYSALKNKILRENSILVTCIGSDMGKVVINKKSCVTNQQLNSIIPYNDNITDYLYYCLKSMHGKLRDIGIGSSTMLMVNKSDFEKIKILSPNKCTLDSFSNLCVKLNAYAWEALQSKHSLQNLCSVLLSGLAHKDNRIAA